MKFKKLPILSVFQTVTRQFRLMGQQTVYAFLLMWHAFRRRDTPVWAKRIIVGAFGYLIAPLDAIPDLSPLIGYTDDLGVLSFGLVAISSYINDDVRINARKRVKKMFGQLDLPSLEAVDAKL